MCTSTETSWRRFSAWLAPAKSATLVQCIWSINFSRVEWENKRKIVDKEDGIIPRNQLFTNQKYKINENKNMKAVNGEEGRWGRTLSAINDFVSHLFACQCCFITAWKAKARLQTASELEFLLIFVCNCWQSCTCLWITTHDARNGLDGWKVMPT